MLGAAIDMPPPVQVDRPLPHPGGPGCIMAVRLLIPLSDPYFIQYTRCICRTT